MGTPATTGRDVSFAVTDEDITRMWLELAQQEGIFCGISSGGTFAAAELYQTAGFGQNRKATGVHDPLMARAVVLMSGGRKIAVDAVFDSVSVKTTFRGPRQIEFEMPASAIERATPNPYFAPGPVQNNGFMGYRAVSISDAMPEASSIAPL